MYSFLAGPANIIASPVHPYLNYQSWNFSFVNDFFKIFHVLRKTFSFNIFIIHLMRQYKQNKVVIRVYSYVQIVMMNLVITQVIILL